jgi:hypothetical protein
MLAALMAALLCLPGLVAAASTEWAKLEPGHSAMWFDASRSGEGWVLEVLPDDGAVLYWFTFDDDGNPRWLGGAGRIERGENGDAVVFDDLYAVRGPRFGPQFDPADLVRERQGHATLRFRDCERGTIAFDAYGRQGEFALTRLTRTMGSGCRPAHGMPGQPVLNQAGQSGSWYEPATSGQGFSLAWLADGSVGVVWFTFDPQGRPYWLTGIGHLEEDRLVFPTLQSTRGGRFVDPFPPAGVERRAWGRLELRLDCAAGDAAYTPVEPGFAAGTMQLRRLTALAAPACPWIKPALTDLYAISATELPTTVHPPRFQVGTPPPGTLPPPWQYGWQDLVLATTVADDGTLHGYVRQEPVDYITLLPDGHPGFTDPAYRARFAPIVLAPGATEWERTGSRSDGAVPIMAAADVLLYNHAVFTPYGIQTDLMPIRANFSNTHPVDVSFINDRFPEPYWNQVIAASRDLRHAVGEAGWVKSGEAGIGDGDTYPWKWSIDGGQEALPARRAIYARATPLCISDDGSRIIGAAWPADAAPEPTGDSVAVQWDGPRLPAELRNAAGRTLILPTACSRDADIVYGQWRASDLDAGNPAAGFWTRDGRSAPTDPLEPSAEDPRGWPYVIQHVSADGSLAAGEYASHDDPPVRGTLLWGQDIGPVRLSEVLKSAGLHPDWPQIHVRGISPSGEYLLLASDPIRNGPARGDGTTIHTLLLRLEKIHP